MTDPATDTADTPSLDEALDHLLAPEDATGTDTGTGATRIGYHLETLAHADWAARRLARAQASIEDLRALADLERRRIAEWLETATARHAADVEWFAGLLEDWHRRTVAADLEAAGADVTDPDEKAWRRLKSKTVPLPSGWTLAATRHAQAVTIDPQADEEARDGAARFVSWALQHEDEAVLDLTRSTTVPAKDAINAAVKAGTLVLTASGNVVLADSSEVVPGLVAEPVTVTFKVRPPKPTTDTPPA